MKRRSSALVIFASLLALWGGCVDYAEPTTPIPVPEPDPGDLTSVPSVSADTDGSTTVVKRGGSARTN